MPAAVAEAANAGFNDYWLDCLRNAVLAPCVPVADTCNSNVFVEQPELPRALFGALGKVLLFPRYQTWLVFELRYVILVLFQINNQVQLEILLL